MSKRLYIAIAIVALLGLTKAWQKQRRPVVATSPVIATSPVAVETPAEPAPTDAVATPPAREPANLPAAPPAVPGEGVRPRPPHRHFDRAANDPAPAPLTRYSHLRLGPVGDVNSRPYRILGARAVRPDGYRSSLGPVIFEESGFRIFEDRGAGWDQLQTSADGRPLMVNPSNGRLVIVTGTLKVMVVDADRAKQLARDENLELIHYDPSIKLAYFKAPPGYRLLPAVARIGGRAGVSLVELETVEAKVVNR